MLLWTDAMALGTESAIRARYESSASCTGVSSTDGRTNQYLQMGGGNILKHVPAAKTMIVGIAHKVAAWSNTEFIRLYDNNGNLQLTLLQNLSGQFLLYRGDSSTGTLLATSAAVSLGFWIYLEFKATIGTTDGSYEFRINGTVQYSASNVNTQNSAYALIGRVNINSRTTANGNADISTDDFYIANTDNPMPVGQFYNSPKIEASFPEGFGDVTGYTPIGNASNWQNVDERAHNSDTDYNYSATLNASDLFAMQNLSAGSGSIYGVQQTYVARKEDALTRWQRPLIKTGGVVYPGGNDSLTTSYVYYYEQWGFSPSTSTWFDVAGINSIQSGYQNVSVA
jgi:hypothetical protein